MAGRLFARIAAITCLALATPAAADDAQPRILIVATSHADVPGSTKTTGLWLSELTDPYVVFRSAGAEVDIATVKGGPPPIDPRSGSRGDVGQKLGSDAAAVAAFEEAAALDRIDTARYDAVFFADGHGTMWDFPGNETISRVVGSFIDAGKPVGAVCHGPAALVSATTADGRPVVAGKRVTAFTDQEESAAGWVALIPFSLEQRLKEQGALFESAGVFRGHAVRDGLIITGRNPASSQGAAALVLAALRERATSAGK